MTNRTRFGAVALSTLAILGLAVSPALAGPGSLTISGTMTGSVDSVPFAAIPFTAVATFSWGADLIPANQPIASYPTSVAFTLGGSGPWAGTYTSDPTAEIFAVLLQPAYTGNGTYGIELQDAGLGTVGDFFTTEHLDAVTQSLVLTGQTDPFESGTFSVPLTDGGLLDVSTFDSQDPMASIGIPEPGALGLVAFALAALGYTRSGEREGGGGPRVFRPWWCYKEPRWRRMHTRRRTSTEQHEAR